MSRKDSTSKLGIAFIVLLIIVAVIYFTGTGKHERNFRKDIVNIDTSAVTQVLIYPKSLKGKSFKLYRSENGWMINYDSNKVDNVPAGKVKNLFNQLLKIKPERVAARSEKKWNEYKVTDKATRVKVVEDGDTTLNLVIGKFTYKPQNRRQNYYFGGQGADMGTFVRLAGEKEVYEVNGFLSMTFDQSPNMWRDNRVVKSSYLKWNRIVFDYPADSSFELAKIGNKWKPSSANVSIDSAQTVKELRTLSNIFSDNFVDDINPDSLKNPDYKITIEGEKDTIVVKGFKLGKRFIVASTQNKGTYFDGNKSNLKKRLFVTLNDFMKKPSPKNSKKK
jgi:hypothetical protein